MQITTFNNNFLALSYKMPNISSFKFANSIKHSLNKMGFSINKIGFSGTLDPFAHGTLILGTNSYTKLLSHIKKDYKTYKATIFLGMESASLDIENIIKIHDVNRFENKCIQEAIGNIGGTITYKPPKFSAKHINGSRAYQLAKNNEEFDLNKITSHIKYLKLINYVHPFLSFEICISEGGYVRSICEIICNNLRTQGSLCFLERIKEGELCYKSIITQNKYISPYKISHKCNATLKSQQNIYNDIISKNKQYHIIDVPFLACGTTQKAKLILLNIKNIIKYDTIKLKEYASMAFNGAKIVLDSNICKSIFGDNVNIDKKSVTDAVSNSVCLSNDYFNNESNYKIFLADFDTHFGIIKVFPNGEVRYILNRIDKC